MYFSPWVTQGGARASLTLGCILEPLTGFSVAPLRARILFGERHWRPSLRGGRGVRVRCWPPLPLPPLLRSGGAGGCIFRCGLPRVALVPR